MSKNHELEEGLSFTPTFDDNGLIPVIAQDHETGDILMLAYMNKEALDKTIEIGQMVYYSRSRQTLWHKGATSGEFQDVIELRTDCDQDAILARIKQYGKGCCHTHRHNCFYRQIISDKTLGHILSS